MSFTGKQREIKGENVRRMAELSTLADPCGGKWLKKFTLWDVQLQLGISTLEIKSEIEGHQIANNSEVFLPPSQFSLLFSVLSCQGLKVSCGKPGSQRACLWHKENKQAAFLQVQ